MARKNPKKNLKDLIKKKLIGNTKRQAERTRIKVAKAKILQKLRTLKRRKKKTRQQIRTSRRPNEEDENLEP